jgi:uncharacterized protein YecE (DUF72 family)
VHDAFRFAVKVPRTVTHMARLSDPSPLEEFLAGVDALGAKLGPLLVQLPRSLAFDPAVVSAFVAALRQGFGGGVVCEPRHPSWFTPEVDEVLASYEVARVAADPPPVADGAKPGGWPGRVYDRLHGSPRRYYSAYPDGFVEDLSRRLAAASEAVPAWCIFDNTAGGAATENALALWQRLQRR